MRSDPVPVYTNKTPLPLVLMAVAFSAVLLGFYLIPVKAAQVNPVSGGVLFWNEPDTGILPLSGEWLFSGNELRLDGWDAAPTRSVPDLWKGERFGYASYRLLIRGLEEGRLYSLRVPYQATAYTLYVNGRPSASNGQVGTDRAASIPEYAPRIIGFTAGKEVTELVLQISNFHHRRGGPFQIIYLGLPDAISRIDLWNIVSDWALVLMYLTMSFYQFAFFAFRKDRSVLFLSLFFLFNGINGLLGTPEVLIFRLVPGFPWFLYQRLCYFVSYGTMVWLILFAWRYAGGLPRKALIGFLIPLFAIFVFVAAAPVYVYSPFNDLFQVYSVFLFGLAFGLIVQAFRRGKEGAGVILIAFVIMVGVMSSSILFSNGKIPGGTYLPLSFLQYFRVTLRGELSVPLTVLSYLLVLLLITILSFTYFLKKPSAFRDSENADADFQNAIQAMDVERASAACGLSAREAEIARLIVSGKTNNEIADTLCISLSTVKTHISRIFRKTGSRSRAQLLFRLQKALSAETEPS